MTRSVLLAGSTGLVGRSVGRLFAQRPEFDLLGLVRTGSSGAGLPVDFEELCAEPKRTLEAFAPEGVEAAISCLGTTIRTAGSQHAMFRVDHDYVVALAEGARALGARQFILVSSVGAGGAGFYLKTKGAVEQAVMQLGFERVDIVRPGFLTGPRSEVRILERLAQGALGLLSPIIPSGFSQYGAIPAEVVASAIVRLVGRPDPGFQIHQNAELTRLARTP